MLKCLCFDEEFRFLERKTHPAGPYKYLQQGWGLNPDLLSEYFDHEAHLSPVRYVRGAEAAQSS